MKEKRNCHRLQRMLVGKAKLLRAERKTVFRNNQRMIKCEKCGNYIPINDAECHHSIIPFGKIRQAFVSNRLNLEDARYFARSKDNIIIVCHKCHKDLHKHSSS